MPAVDRRSSTLPTGTGFTHDRTQLAEISVSFFSWVGTLSPDLRVCTLGFIPIEYVSMGLNPQDIQRVALLARLSIDDTESEELSQQLSNIVALVDQLSEVDTEGVEPMVHAFELHNVLAPDEVQPSLPRDKVLKNAPLSDGECFRVPPVLG